MPEISKESVRNLAYGRKSAARLTAVQLIYEHCLTGEGLDALRRDFQLHRKASLMDEPETGEDVLLEPDENLLHQILQDLQSHLSIVTSLTDKTLEKKKAPELIIKAILLAAATELFTAADRGIDQPIILNDYLEVTRAFYGDAEVKYMNGLLNEIMNLMA